MAVRDDWAPGEVLTSTDLNDTFASKPNTSGFLTASRYVTDSDNLGTSYGTVDSLTFTATGEPVLIICTFLYSNGNSGGNRYMDVQLLRGSTLVGNEMTSFFAPFVSGAGTPLMATLHVVDTPSAGSVTYNLQGRCASAAAAVITSRYSWSVMGIVT